MPKSKLSEVYKEYIQIFSKFRILDKTRTYKNIVGDMGEEHACSFYGMIKSNGTGFDALKDNLKVEIKTRTNVSGKIEIKPDAEAQILIVLHLTDEGEFTEYYRGSMKAFFDQSRFVERSKDHQMTLVN